MRRGANSQARRADGGVSGQDEGGGPGNNVGGERAAEHDAEERGSVQIPFSKAERTRC